MWLRRCAGLWLLWGLLNPAAAGDEANNATAVRRQDLERHVSFLASDTLEGREAGSRGGAAAGQYIISELKKYGVAPAGDSGRYIQDFVPSYKNVLGLLPPRGPEASDDVVLIGAHYDHVGYGRSTNSAGPIGYIHNGADDNASGTAAVLEVAQALAASAEPRRCSVLIAFWDAEELNLNGSEYWCQHPTIPLNRIRLAINIDMIGRLTDRGAEVHGARSAPGLRARLARANATSDVYLRFKDDHTRNSDHYTFFQRRMPYLMVDTGEHADYHRPTDDIERLNLDGLERMTQMLLNVTAASARESTPPFRKECLNEARFRTALVSPPQRFGIAWAAVTEPQPLQITEVVPGSAAARADLRVGDRLMQFGDHEPRETATFRKVIAETDTPVTVVVERPGSSEPISTIVTLDGTPPGWGYATADDPAEPGCPLVTAVTAKSPAATADLKVGDRILERERVQTTGFRGDGPSDRKEVRLLIERDGRVSWRTLSRD